jgi:23S rRNA (cytosine1962-C5)-methyltransferase
MPGIVIKPRARIYHGHDWVYTSEVMKTWGNPTDGSVITIKDGKDRLMGSGIYNSKSQIVARRFSRQKQDLDLDFFKRRIAQAIEYRKARGIVRDVCRLVWSESDGLPGLIIDRYGDCFVLQTLTLAMDQRQDLILEALLDYLPLMFEPESEIGGDRQSEGLPPSLKNLLIVERNDAPIRKAEGLELRTSVLHGEARLLDLEILGVKFQIDPLQGQKTGFYLDQVESYAEIARWAAGKRVLDVFANQGAFGLFCAKAGAARVTSVEISAEAVAQIKANSERNGLNVEALEQNAFDFLKAAEHQEEKYDLIILDPPSFTKSREKLQDAMRGYKEIHLRALKLLAPGGLLATFSCSHHVSTEIFREMIVDSLVDAKKSARLIQTLQQSPDHPILLSVPETEYLKGFLLELAPGR